MHCIALHYWLRPYADHELEHSDVDNHDRSQWTEANKLDAIGLVCEILPTVFAMYFLAAYGENILGSTGGGSIQNVTGPDGTTTLQYVADDGTENEYGWLHYVVASLALFVAAVPLVLSVVLAARACRATRAQKALAEDASATGGDDEQQADESPGHYENPAVDHKPKSEQADK